MGENSISPAQTDALAKLAEIPAVGSEELARLSRDAAAGPWSVSGARRSFSERSCVFIDAPSCAGLLVLATGQGAQALEALRDARFVVALVNAYRSGKLIPAPALAAPVQEGSFGASASPSGSQASPEAPTDPRPTGVDPSRMLADVLKLAADFEESGKSLIEPEQYSPEHVRAWEEAHRYCARDLRTLVAAWGRP